MNYSLPGSSVHGILQARILEWIAIPFSRGSAQPRDLTQVSSIAGKFFTVWAMTPIANKKLKKKKSKLGSQEQERVSFWLTFAVSDSTHKKASAQGKQSEQDDGHLRSPNI